MLRKMITLILFTMTVPIAVFGQHAFGGEHLKTILVGMGERAHHSWPETRKHIEKALPDAVQGMATRMNDYSPSAGTNTPSYCTSVDLWENKGLKNKFEPTISI